MCGRFDRHSSLADFSHVIDKLQVEASEDLPASYNITPSQHALVIRNAPEGPVASALAWGLAPSWIKDSNKIRPINARSETVNERPMFRHSFRTQRCLILCDGYYEWQQQVSGPKQPFYLQRADETPFVLAGLWERNESLGDEPLETFCILTKTASTTVDRIHHRMPICLPRDAQADWLNSTVRDLAHLYQLMASAENDWMFYPVSRYVNSPHNDSNRCLERLREVELS
jgi:putative SOS response-associated peptidase YedK